MRTQSFKLQPFQTSILQPAVELCGELSRDAEQMRIQYVLQDPKGEILIPTSNEASSRQNNLWMATCFELFFGSPDSEAYWEINLSPAGHWNVYRFDAYRSGMQEEAAFDTFPFAVEYRESELRLQLDIDLGALGLTEAKLEVAIATVLQSKNNTISYWALSHPGPEADFHRRDSFILKT